MDSIQDFIPLFVAYFAGAVGWAIRVELRQNSLQQSINEIARAQADRKDNDAKIMRKLDLISEQMIRSDEQIKTLFRIADDHHEPRQKR